MPSLESILSNKLYFKVGGDWIFYKSPRIYLKQKAQLLYEQTVDEYKYEDWLTKDLAFLFLVKNGIVDRAVHNNLKEMDKEIEEQKLQLYKNYYNQNQSKKIRKRLGQIREKQTEVLNALHLLDYLTIEGYAELIKNQYLLQNSIFVGKKKYLGESTELARIQHITELLNSSRPNNTDLRKLARSDEWSSIWRSSKGHPFKGPSYDWTDEQRSLVMISQMYDSVYKHNECPPDKIIEDDDVLDGWLVFQRRKIEKDKTESTINNTMPGVNKGKGRGGDHFVFNMSEGEAESSFTPEQIADIEGLNSSHAKFLKAQREGLIKQAGEVRDIQFLDQQLSLQRQANEAFINAGRK